MYRNIIFFCAISVLLMLNSFLYGQEAKFLLASIHCDENVNRYVEKLMQADKETLTFLNKERSAVTGLVESFHGSSPYYYDPASEQYYPDKVGILDEQGFTYDLALVIMVYALNGHFDKARKILSVLEKNFPVEKNGYIGLFNSYVITDFDTWGEDILKMGIDGDRIHVGPNMWVAMAALQFNKITGSHEFLPFALEISKWAYNLPHFKFPDGSRGPASMGSGWGPDWSTVFSTENVIDNYAVLKTLEEVYIGADEKIRKIFEQKKFGWTEILLEKASIIKWLKEVGFNPQYQSFNCGYNENGVDKTKALDTVSWGIAAISPAELIKWGIDPFKMIEFAENNFMIEQTISGEAIKGFDFTDEKYKDPNRARLIWWEGTGQMVLAYQIMADYCQQTGDTDRMVEYQNKALIFSREMGKMAKITGLPSGTLPYTSIQPKDTEIINTFSYGWEIPRGLNGQWVSSLSSTLWRVIGVSGFNPLDSRQNTFGMLYRLGTEMWAKVARH